MPIGMRRRGYRPLHVGDSVLLLLRDEFTTDDAAPITSPRTAEPGPGTLSLYDSANTLAISGGEVVPNAAATATGNPAVYSTAGYTRVAGRAFKVDVKRVSAYGTDANKLFSPAIAWCTATASSNIANYSGLAFTSSTIGIVTGQATQIMLMLDAIASDTYYEFGLVLMAAGAVYLMNRKVVFVLRRVTTTPMYPHVIGVATGRHPSGIDNFVVADLGGAWASPTSIATNWLSGARSAGETFTHQADCILEFTATLPSSGNVQIAFRKQDANNYWQLSLDSTGNLVLNEVVAGTPTGRQSLGANQNGDRLGALVVGTSIRLFRDRPGAETTNTTYASATNFQTQTSGEIQSLGTGGGASDVISWPRDPDAAAMARYDSA